MRRMHQTALGAVTLDSIWTQNQKAESAQSIVEVDVLGENQTAALVVLIWQKCYKRG